MNIDLRTATIAVLLIAGAGCKGAEDARAKTPPAASSALATASSAATAAAAVTATTTPTTDPLVAHADSARIRGNPAAKVWMIIASDFQCPYCKMWHEAANLPPVAARHHHVQ